MTTVLVVDDDRTLQRTLRITLRARDYDVVVVGTGRDALSDVAELHPDLVVLDLGLPDMDGLDVLRQIRAVSALPVIVLSARHDSEDKVAALDEGADDYVTKPFGMDELLARVRVALRRVEREFADVPAFVTPRVRVDFVSRDASRDGAPLRLTPIEWRLLAELARARGGLVGHETLLKAVWGPAYGRELNYLRVYANQLRRKIEDDPGRPLHLVTEPGLGYRLVS